MRIWIAWGALFGGLSVFLGAFGAHSLKAMLEPAQLATFQTAVQYQFIHSLALLLTGILSLNADESLKQKLKFPANCFIAGILMFSGSLYALALGGPRFFGPLTPLGGLALMAGWFTLAARFFKKP